MLDGHAHRQRVVARGTAQAEADLDPRVRLLAALILAFGFASVVQAQTVPALLVLALLLASGLGALRRVLGGLRVAAFLALGFVVVLPLASGETVLWQAGPLVVRAEGLEAGLLIGGRLLAIVAVALALLGAVPALHLVGALRALRVPSLLADLALLTLRYLDDLRAEIARMRLARRMRGGHRGWQGLGSEGLLLAAVLIRSQRRAERLWAAMRLRGYDAGIAAPMPQLALRDHLALAGAAVVALAAIALDRLA